MFDTIQKTLLRIMLWENFNAAVPHDFILGLSF